MLLVSLCAAIAMASHKDTQLAGQLVDVSSIEVLGPDDTSLAIGINKFMRHIQSHVEKLSGISNWIGEPTTRRFVFHLSIRPLTIDITPIKDTL